MSIKLNSFYFNCKFTNQKFDRQKPNRPIQIMGCTTLKKFDMNWLIHISRYQVFYSTAHYASSLMWVMHYLFFKTAYCSEFNDVCTARTILDFIFDWFRAWIKVNLISKVAFHVGLNYRAKEGFICHVLLEISPNSAILRSLLQTHHSNLS